jgi:hypothetical protein
MDELELIVETESPVTAPRAALFSRKGRGSPESPQAARFPRKGRGPRLRLSAIQRHHRVPRIGPGSRVGLRGFREKEEGSPRLSAIHRLWSFGGGGRQCRLSAIRFEGAAQDSRDAAPPVHRSPESHQAARFPRKGRGARLRPPHVPSITVSNIKSSEVTFAYSVHKESSAHGKQSSAEARTVCRHHRHGETARGLSPGSVRSCARQTSRAGPSWPVSPA